jgi:outer membrane biosynthesis protein TonB
VSVENSVEGAALKEQLDREQERLASLHAELRAIDQELEALGERREQFELLDHVCTSLDSLEQLGAADLFWGTTADPAATARQLATVREQTAEFWTEVAAIEERRKGFIARILEQDDVLADLNEDWEEQKEQEEAQKFEWVLEREAEPTPLRRIVMPWLRGCEEDRLFHRNLLAAVAASLVLGILVSLVELPIPDRAELLEVPDRVAKVIETRPKPPPAQPVPEEPPLPEEIPEPEPVMAEEQPPEEIPEVVEPPAKVAEQTQKPKESARSKGLLAFRDSFAKRAKVSPSAALGARARVGNAGDASIGRPERAMVTTQAPGSSGGINLADLSRDAGGGAGGQQMTGVAVSQVASSIGGDGSADRPLSGGPGAGRTDEEIQIVFDRYKASLYRLYNRELRKDPTLRGQLVLRLTIEPDGSVSMCMLHDSDMGAPILAEQVVTRVQGFDFGAKENITAMTIIYPIDFLPAA